MFCLSILFISGTRFCDHTAALSNGLCFTEIISFRINDIGIRTDKNIRVVDVN